MKLMIAILALAISVLLFDSVAAQCVDGACSTQTQYAQFRLRPVAQRAVFAPIAWRQRVVTSVSPQVQYAPQPVIRYYSPPSYYVPQATHAQQPTRSIMRPLRSCANGRCN